MFEATLVIKKMSADDAIANLPLKSPFEGAIDGHQLSAAPFSPSSDVSTSLFKHLCGLMTNGGCDHCQHCLKRVKEQAFSKIKHHH